MLTTTRPHPRAADHQGPGVRHALERLEIEGELGRRPVGVVCARVQRHHRLRPAPCLGGLEPDGDDGLKTQGKLRFVLLEAIGSATVRADVSPAMLAETLRLAA